MIISGKNVLFAISSCKKFYEKTLDKCIGSLLECGVPPLDILCVVGGHTPEECTEQSDARLQESFGKAKLVTSTLNSLEYNVFIYLVQNKQLLLQYDYIFFMHDTSWAGPKFIELLNQTFPKNNPKTYALTPFPSMGIGLYSAEHLLAREGDILATKNESLDHETEQRIKKWGVFAEDMLLAHECGNFMKSTGGKENVTFVNPFGTGTPRRVRHFTFLDFYKSQANFSGPQSTMIIDI